MLYIAGCKPMHDYDLLLAWDWECTKRSAPVFQCSSPEDFPVHSFVIIIASLLSNASKNIHQMWFETWMSDQTFLVLVRFEFSQNIKMLLNTVTLEGAQLTMLMVHMKTQPTPIPQKKEKLIQSILTLKIALDLTSVVFIPTSHAVVVTGGGGGLRLPGRLQRWLWFKRLLPVPVLCASLPQWRIPEKCLAVVGYY